MAIVLEV